MNEFLLQGFYNFCVLILRPSQILFACNFDKDIYLNLKYLYLNSKANGLKSEILYSRRKDFLEALKTIIAFAKARVIIVDCSHWIVSKITLSESTKVIYVGHGGGCYKKMGFSLHGSSSSFNSKKIKKLYGQFTYVLSTSSEFDKNICLNYKITEDKLLKSGLPRTDRLFGKIKYYPKISSKKILLFAPSFKVLNGVRTHTIDVQRVAEISNKLGWEVWYSEHPDIHAKQLYPINWVSCAEKTYEEKILAPDVLLTDRSSVMFDFCLTGKPIIIFDELPEDNLWISKYQLKGVNLCSSFEALRNLLSNHRQILSSHNLYKQQMHRCDGKSCEKFSIFLKSLLK